MSDDQPALDLGIEEPSAEPATPAEAIAETVTDATEDPAVVEIADAVAETSPEPAAAEVAEPEATAAPEAAATEAVPEAEPDAPAEPETAATEAVPEPEPEATAEPEAAGTEAVPQPEPEPEKPALDLNALAAQATRLQEEWKAAGFAGKEVEDELGPLFRSYLDVIWGAQRKASSGKISARKALVREARALASKATEASASEISGLVRDAKALQERWKAGEPAPRGPENTSWQQFSGALREVFSAREKLHGDATAERQEIVAAMSALVNSRDAFRAVKEVGPLLKRWGAAGPVPGKVYAELKAKLDNDLTQIRSRADAERKRREAEDDKSQAERAKHASKLVKEAERSRRGSGGPARPSSSGGGGADSALAAAFAAAFNKTDVVAKEVAELEETVATLEARLAAGQRADLDAVRAETGQGFTVTLQVDKSERDPAKVTKQLEVARAALKRRRADLDALQSKAGELGLR